jgi:hypothetical protein
MRTSGIYRWIQAAGLAILFSFAIPRPLSAGIVYVQPIQVCDDDGANCANSAEELFSAATNKIWAQAGITIDFLSFTTLDSTALQIINTAADLNSLFTDASANASATVISMWFVKTINNCGGDPAYGCATLSGNRIAIDDDTFSFNSGAGRIDTIAHEIGHSLGLGHCNEGGGTCGGDFLMNGGGRTIPGGLGDITPDGAKLDKLSAGEITTAQASPLNTPEPGTVTLAALGVIAFTFRRRLA